MAKRNERSRLIDNIGRQIRRLNERERNGTLDDFQRRGLERQRDNLTRFREEVKKIDKNDKTALEKAKHDYKSNGNYSSSQRTIDQNTKRLLATEAVSDEDLEEYERTKRETEPETEEPEPGTEPGGEGGILGGGEGEGESTTMSLLEDLYHDLAAIDGKYIGAYASAEVQDQLQKILDKIQHITEMEELDVESDTRRELENLARSIESARADRKGNFAIRDENGGIIGYQNTFSRSRFESFLEKTSPVNFDVNKWIAQNAELFSQSQSHPGRLSSEEVWYRNNAGVLGDWDV